MKTKVLSIILLGASLGLGSCSDYLDMTPTDRASDKLVWSKLDYAEQAVNDFYRYIDY
ncbi:RagB/SusD family nutrient uptake outer membrane protein, partial [Bacteroides xylanisolvens]